jgi:hypothetical protein
MIVTGCIHTAVMLVMLVLHWSAIAVEPLFGVTSNSTTGGFVWFAMIGLLVIMVGIAMHCYIRATGKPVPRSLGVVLALVSLVILLTMPVSGVWLFVLQLPVIFFRPGYKKALARSNASVQPTPAK